MDQILATLNTINAKLDNLIQWKAVHQESHKTIDRDMNEVRDTLFESSGLKSQVQTLMNGSTSISRWRDFGMGILKLVVVAAIIAVTTWFMVEHQKGGQNEILKASELETTINNGNQTERD